MRLFKTWIPIWVVPVIATFAIGTTWLRLGIIRTTYEINQEEKEIRNLQIEREQMELKVTALRSPRRLEAIARSRFGLSQPVSDRIVQMNGQINGQIAAGR